ncbi:DUF3152 domain-containing protein [Marinactinospora rubrisoli]|uniref:DUF3152 domain-containing protein n=1 Tax=Marinactinospora rubrisoli TaxID=2715399 RepID=A0ABW2KCM1_9ACTN
MSAGVVLLATGTLPPGEWLVNAANFSTVPPHAGSARPADPAEAAAPRPPEEQAPAPPVLLRSVVPEVATADGELTVVAGESPVRGSGPLRRYLVEVEEGLPGAAGDFAAAVDEVLADPRGWIGDGMSVQRVDSGPVDFRVALAAPATVDDLCYPLRTEGEVSCTQGDRAIINQNRWVSGVRHFDGDLATYRVYVVNHEVGHALGHGHVTCPGAGERAPVMQQQTLGLQGCEPNGWPHP